MSIYDTLLKPLLFRMDPEKAHHLIIGGLRKAAAVPGAVPMFGGMYGFEPDPILAVPLFGLTFKHPIGLAAGLDKNAEAVPGFSAAGFSFIEVGTVTPKGQPGNDKPRLFRLPEDTALINRMGFNNQGAPAMAANLQRVAKRPIPVAVNIGKNKVTPNEAAIDDYLRCIQTLYTHGDFFVVNISSPNTPGLRALQHGEELRSLLVAVVKEIAVQAKKHAQQPKSVLVKIAPDLSEAELADMLPTIADSGVSGIIATNTTLSREGLRHAAREEAGGLSGAPLTQRSTAIIRQVYRDTGGRLPIIGVGGIFSGADAYEKICAGASLVEIYTSFVYHGPAIIKKIADELTQLLKQDGFSCLRDAVGSKVN